MNGQIEEKTVILNNHLVHYYSNTATKFKNNNIVFLHGWLSSSKVWFPFVNELNELGYNVYAIDFPGFGESEKPRHPFSLQDYAEIILAFINKLKISDPVLITHSFGGRVGIKMTAQNPNIVQKLVLCNSAGFITDNFKRTLYPQLAKITKPLFKPLFMQGIRKKIYSMLGSYDYLAAPELQETFKKINDEDLTSLLPQIKTKTLIVWGQNDKETPLNFAGKLKEGINNSQLFVLKNAGHFSFLDQPEEFKKILIEFLNEK